MIDNMLALHNHLPQITVWIETMLCIYTDLSQVIHETITKDFVGNLI